MKGGGVGVAVIGVGGGGVGGGGVGGGGGGGGVLACRDDFTARPAGVCLKPTKAKDVSSAKCFELR
jgi:hypothetical protein